MKFSVLSVLSMSVIEAQSAQAQNFPLPFKNQDSFKQGLSQVTSLIMDQIPPEFCWKKADDAAPHAPTNCPKGYSVIGLQCVENCRSGYSLVGTQCYSNSCPSGYKMYFGQCKSCKWVDKKKKVGWSYVKYKKYECKTKQRHTYDVETTNITQQCENDRQLILGTCQTQCENLQAGSMDCGPAACARNEQTCVDTVSNMVKDTVEGAAMFAAFVATLGASSGATIARNQAKAQLKKSVKEMGESQAKEIAINGMNYILNNRDQVCENVVNEMGSNGWTSLINLPDAQVEQFGRSFCSKYIQALSTINSGNRDQGSDQMIDGLVDFSDDADYNACQASQTDDNVNESIKCAKSVLTTAQMFDPTGLTLIAAAYLHPICDL